MRSLAGMGIIITGASSGIGLAVALEAYRRGARLVLTGRRGDRLDALNRELGGGHTVVVADVGVEADCVRLIEAGFAAWGRVDVVVCNAGYGEMRPIGEMSAEAERRMFEVNVFGTTACIRAALPRLCRQDVVHGYRGQVMMVSSGAARRGLPMLGTYSATKAAQLSIAEALRVELRGTGVAVTSVHPVGTKTEFFDVAEEKGGRKMPARGVGERMQSAEHVARRMVNAMARPVREVWPLRPARWALSLATLLPALGDWAVERRVWKERSGAEPGGTAADVEGGGPPR